MQSQISVFPCLAGLALAFGLFKSAPASTVSVDDFTQLTDSTFIDVGRVYLNGIPAISGATSASGGGVNIVGHPPSVGQLGLGVLAGPSASDPGDGEGWAAGSITRNSFGDGPVVLDFDIPIAGFGASFLHFLNPNFEPFSAPALLEVFDMPTGNGNLLGSVISSGGTVAQRDFVGIWTNTRIIRSAVLSVTTGSFAVDGYAVTQTPLPEPSAFVLLVCYLSCPSPINRFCVRWPG
jgi:hypothetical protein